MSLPYLGAVGAHKRALIAITAIAAISAVALLVASIAFLQPAAVAPKGGTADSVGLKGIVDIVVKDSQGNIKYQKTVKNAILTSGLQAVVQRVFNPKPATGFTTEFDNIVFVGQDSASPPASFSWKVLASFSAVRTTYDGDTAQLVATVAIPAAGITGTIYTDASGASVSGSTSQDGKTLTIGTTTYTLPMKVETLKIENDASESTDFSSVSTLVQLSPGDSLQVTWKIIVKAST
jgi:hypothetical protein